MTEKYGICDHGCTMQALLLAQALYNDAGLRDEIVAKITEMGKPSRYVGDDVDRKGFLAAAMSATIRDQRDKLRL